MATDDIIFITSYCRRESLSSQMSKVRAASGRDEESVSGSAALQKARRFAPVGLFLG